MRVSTQIVIDIETGAVLSRESLEYDGPVVLAKGGSQALSQMNTEDALAGNLTGQGLGINSSLVPVLQNEVNNPIGFGQQALTQMQTEGGQNAAASQGAAQNRATLAAARTGNLASLPAVQDKLARSGTQSADQNSLGLDVENAQLKQKQQQQGISGLQQLGSSELGQGENALGLSNQSLGQYMQAANWWQNLIPGATGAAGQAFQGKG